jgi:predicted nucleic acid-binding protein
MKPPSDLKIQSKRMAGQTSIFSKAIVADTSPLVALFAAGRLNLLPAIWPAVVVPPAVHSELTIQPGKWVAAQNIRQSLGREPWLTLLPAVDMRALPLPAPAKLGRGEIEVIALAKSMSLQAMIDDYEGRLFAQKCGVTVVGTLGILALARQRGLLEKVEPIIQAMRAAGIYYGPALVESFLKQLGER